MADAFSRTVPLAMPLEIERARGDGEEARLQLAVFHASSLAFLDSYQANDWDLFPMPSWTVIGHEWTLYIAWKDADGATQVRGPSVGRTVGTMNFQSLFALLELIRDSFKWLRSYYQRWYISLLTAHMDSLDADSVASGRPAT